MGNRPEWEQQTCPQNITREQRLFYGFLNETGYKERK